MLAIALIVDSETNTLINEPILYSKGLINKGSKSITVNLKELINQAVINKLKTKTNYNELKTIVKVVASDFLFKKINRNPMIIPLIMSRSKK